MSNLKSYNSKFEEKIQKTLELINNDPSTENKNILQNYLKNNFDSNKATIFEMFSSDRLTLEQQKILFNSIEVKQKCQLYNTISVDSRKNFYNSLSVDDAKRSGKSHAAPALF